MPRANSEGRLLGTIMTKDEVLQMFRESGALLEGHFRLTSGLHSDRYLQCALVLQNANQAALLGAALASGLKTISEAPDLPIQGAIVEVIVTKRAEAGGSTPLFAGKRWGVVLAVLASLFAYALVLNFLGFLAATFLVLTLLFKIPAQQSWKGALGAAALTTAGTYALFAYALQCSLPSGILEFLGL